MGNALYCSDHHFNNGSVLLSPLLRGNRVFGGVVPATLLTYGFDGRTGEARRGVQHASGEVTNASRTADWTCSSKAVWALAPRTSKYGRRCAEIARAT